MDYIVVIWGLYRDYKVYLGIAGLYTPTPKHSTRTSAQQAAMVARAVASAIAPVVSEAPGTTRLGGFGLGVTLSQGFDDVCRSSSERGIVSCESSLGPSRRR